MVIMLLIKLMPYTLRNRKEYLAKTLKMRYVQIIVISKT